MALGRFLKSFASSLNRDTSKKGSASTFSGEQSCDPKMLAVTAGNFCQIRQNFGSVGLRSLSTKKKYYKTIVYRALMFGMACASREAPLSLLFGCTRSRGRE
jgi:hypothetical protein